MVKAAEISFKLLHRGEDTFIDIQKDGDSEEVMNLLILGTVKHLISNSQPGMERRNMEMLQAKLHGFFQMEMMQDTAFLDITALEQVLKGKEG